MIKNQNCAVESYMAPSCMIFNVQAKDILCASILGDGTELPGADESDWGIL